MNLARVATGAFAVAMIAAAALVTGAPAAADVSVAATNCHARMADTVPRYYNERTLDSGRNGRTYGYVWVDRRSDVGYNVCVGWPSGVPPFPYEAVVEDVPPGDAHGAIAYVTYEAWTGSGWGPRQRQYLERADGAGDTEGYNFVNRVPVRGFYVGVCLIAAGVVSACNDERGTD